jgi:hypothetical protein
LVVEPQKWGDLLHKMIYRPRSGPMRRFTFAQPAPR